jgi:prepilin-type N-terminal cleavage/methylation domain-containing protein
MKSNLPRSSSGFTLVELIIVIGIIAILSGIIIANLTGSKAKSRDAQRISDLNQIQLALEQYFDRCGQYPLVDGSNMPSTASTCSGAGVTVNINSYISKIPQDPLSSGSYKYIYVANNGTTPTDYVLHATLEGPNANQQNSFPESVRSDPNHTWATGFSCYNGSGTDYCVSTK